MQETLRYQGDRFRVMHVVPDADSGLPERDVIRHPGAVLIVPVLDDGSLVLIRNYRLSVQRELLELPAGTRDKIEPAEATAVRELEEETGYVPGSIELIGSFLMSPGILDEHMHVYVARQLSRRQQRLEADERITVLHATLEQTLDWIANGELVDAKSIAALQMYQLRMARQNSGQAS